MTVRTKRACCPSCFYVFDSCSVLGREGESIEPENGEPTVCLNCGRLMIFHEGVAMSATAAEVRELMTEPEMWTRIETVRAIIMQRGRFA